MKKIPAKLSMASVLLGLILIATVVALSACTSAPTPAPTPTGHTFQMLADAGQPVYVSSCAVCHGNNGQPANKYTVLLWGTGSTLGTYHGITLFTDAQGMLNYMSKNMPLAASGSLSNQQYIDLLAYILVQASIVSPSTAFDESKLSSISIP
jgi:mono/diheme cytochrome c family protein